MIAKKILNPDRLRHIKGGFSFIPHRFLTDGFLASLSQTEILLYLFLVLVGDRHGVSFYAYDSICTLLQFSLEDVTTGQKWTHVGCFFGPTHIQSVELPRGNL